MPLTLGKLGYGYENGVQRNPSRLYEKPTTQKLLQKIKTTTETGNESNPDGEKKLFSIQHSSYLSLMNCFDLLTDLTNYSQEMFTDLLGLMKTTNQRLTQVNNKFKSLQENDVENQIKNSTFTLVLTQDGSSKKNHSQFNIPQQFQSAPYRFTISLIDRHQLSLSLIRNLSKLHPKPDFDPFNAISLEYFSQVENKEIENIGDNYSSPEFFLNQWLLQQEKRLQDLEVVKKQHKLDRKKREKAKQLAVTQQGSRRKSAGDGIQIVRWQDRYQGDGRSRPTTMKSKMTNISSRSQFFLSSSRPMTMKSLNFDDDDEEEEGGDESTRAGSSRKTGISNRDRSTSIPMSDISEGDAIMVANTVANAAMMTTSSHRPPLPPTAASAHKDKDKDKDMTSPSTLKNLFPVVDISKKPPMSSPAFSSHLSKDDDDEDEDEEETQAAESNKVTGRMFAAQSMDSEDTDVLSVPDSRLTDSFDTDMSRSPDKNSILVEGATPSKTVRIALTEEEVLLKIQEELKTLVVDLDDSSTFISPIPFVVFDDDVLSALPASIRSSMNTRGSDFRYSRVFKEKEKGKEVAEKGIAEYEDNALSPKRENVGKREKIDCILRFIKKNISIFFS
jgi:hypothetical protein